MTISPVSSTATEKTIQQSQINFDGWVFESESCYFDLEVGFSTEWDAMLTSFVVANVKMTDSHVESGEVLELAALLVDPSGSVAAEFSVLVNTVEPITSSLSKETGITQTEVDREGQPLRNAIKAFVDFAGSRPIFTHGDTLSVAVLNKAGISTQQRFANTVYDTLIMAILAWSPIDCDSLDTFAAHVGAPKAGRRAINDAKVTLAVLLAVRHQAGQETARRNALRGCAK